MSERQLCCFNSLVKLSKYVSENYRSEEMGFSSEIASLIVKIKDMVSCINDEDVSNPYFGIDDLLMDHSTWINTLFSIAHRVSTAAGIPPEHLLVDLRSEVLPYDPSYGVSIMEMLAKLEFNPECAKPIDISPKPNFPKLPRGRETPVCAELAATLLTLDNDYGYLFAYPFSSGLLYNKEFSIPQRMIKGKCSNMKSYFSTLARLNLNKCDPVREFSANGVVFNVVDELSHALDSINYRMGLGSDPIPVSFSRPAIYERLSKMNTSLGWYHKLINKVTVKGNAPVYSVKKQDVAGYIADDIVEYVAQVEKFVRGEGPEPVVPVINTEQVKIEPVTTDIIHKIFSASDANSVNSKERIYYAAGVFSFIFQSVFFEQLSKWLTSWRIGIGIRVQGGGIQMMADLLAGSPKSPYYDRWVEGCERAREFGVDLSIRKSGKGDFSKYDQSILAMLLAFFSVSVYPFLEPVEGLSKEAFDYLFQKCVFDIIYKMCNIYGFNTVMMIWGCMFSGMYVTSVGDSFCLAILIEMYCTRLRTMYPDDKVLEIVIEYEMMVYEIFGDDHNGSYPEYMDRVKLYESSECSLDDFVQFCCTVFGMNYKLAERGIYDNVYSIKQYRTVGEGIYQLIESYDGVSFIKNAPAHVFLDQDYLGVYPYQETHHIISKMKSLNASASVHLSMCLISSLARLCAGNLEVYSQLYMIYYTLKAEYGNPNEDHWRKFLELKLGRSVLDVQKAYGDLDVVPGFPSLVEIMADQDIGYQSGTGFARISEGGAAFDMSKVLLNQNVNNVLNDYWLTDRADCFKEPADGAFKDVYDAIEFDW